MTRSRRHRRLFALLALIAITAGCAGPEEPLEVGVKGIPSDVVLGSQREPEEIPTFLPPSASPPPRLMPSEFAIDAPPPVADVGRTTLPPTPDPCPAADPLAAPRREAPNSVLGPPVPATYTYRNKGRFEVGGPNAVKGPFPPVSTSTIRNVAVAEDGSFTHEVVEVLGPRTTTTTYRTVTLESGGGNGGIFITSVSTQMEGEDPQTFDPSPDLELLRFPIQVGTKWQSVGADPDVGSIMVYNAEVRVKRRVDACGAMLDAHVVTIDGNAAPCAEVKPTAPPKPPPEAEGVVTTSTLPGVKQCAPPQRGTEASATSGSSFTATYVIGTQYGGVALLVDRTIDSTSGGVGAHQENVSTITTEPAPAAAP